MKRRAWLCVIPTSLWYCSTWAYVSWQQNKYGFIKQTSNLLRRTYLNLMQSLVTLLLCVSPEGNAFHHIKLPTIPRPHLECTANRSPNNTVLLSGLDMENLNFTHSSCVIGSHNRGMVDTHNNRQDICRNPILRAISEQDRGRAVKE